MTNVQSNVDGSLGEDEYQWLISRARAGFGTIITCAAHVTEDGQGWQGELGIFNDRLLPGLTRLSKGIRDAGSLAIVQLYHGGMRAPEDVTGKQPFSASAQAIKKRDGSEMLIREATTEDIQRVITAFGEAAQRAYKAGFDGVELHGAHGYLLSQFLSTVYNQREDAWGGSMEKRFRFILSCLSAVRRNVPESFIVGVRISPESRGFAEGIDLNESLALTHYLSHSGADYIHVSIWDAFKKADHDPEGPTIIEHFRDVIPKDVVMMVAGELRTKADLTRAMDEGADMLAIGKAAIGDTDWPEKVRSEDYVPAPPPYTEEHLKKQHLGPAFIEYMKRWPGFVSV